MIIPIKYQTEYSHILEAKNNKILQLKECFDFISCCAEEIKLLIAEHDVAHIENVPFHLMRRITEPYPMICFDEGNIKLYVSKVLMFRTNAHSICVQHIAQWIDSKNTIIEINIRKQQ
jgi:hypothetical protein